MKRTVSILLALALILGCTGYVRAAELPDVTQYTYKVTPILAPFAYYLYVETDNPDPASFRLVDEHSEFYAAGEKGEIRLPNSLGYSYVEVDPGTYYACPYRFADAVYENADTGRVHGGYIFLAGGAFSDGGEFTLLQRTAAGSSILNDRFEKTAIKVPCQKLETRYSWLLNTCVTEDMDFFEKLDAVEAYLDKVSVYPRSFFDMDRPNESLPYPLLAASPYPELGLNEHYNMYASSDDFLLSDAYPFILDSASFPGTMRVIARTLEPHCVIESTGYHYLTKITLGETTKTYGGAGSGGYTPLFSERLEKVFAFTGAEGDFGTKATIEDFHTLLRSYEPIAEADMAPYEDLILGETYRKTIAATGGTWIRIGVEGFGMGTSFGYVVPLGDSTLLASDAWVDGRYVNNCERIVLNTTFEEHPRADIIVPNVTYTDMNGDRRTQAVIYSYDSQKDAWTAPMFYTNDFWWPSNVTLPAELVLTRAQVEAMGVDKNNAHLPESGLVYDGREYPGTPFTVVPVSGIRLQETAEVGIRGSLTIEAEVSPADAYDGRVAWTSSDTDVLGVTALEGGKATLYGYKAGTVTLTAATVDGGYTAVCTVTVKDLCAQGHAWDEGTVIYEPDCRWTGQIRYRCVNCGEQKYEEIPALGHDYVETVTPPTCTEGGFTTGICTRCGDEKTGSWTQPLGHDYKNTVTPPTCTESGFTTGVCTRCGDEKTGSRVPALGHDYQEGFCTRCGREDDGTEPPVTLDFVDVAENAYYRSAVVWAVDRQVTSGVDKTHFGPDRACTRAQAVTFLWRAAGQPEPEITENPFADVHPEDYYYKAVLWALENGVTGGVSKTEFAPGKACTRAQIVTFLYRFAGQPAVTGESAFADVKGSDYFAAAVLWAGENDVTQGTGGGLFSPGGKCTRAQIVTFLYRAVA